MDGEKANINMNVKVYEKNNIKMYMVVKRIFDIVGGALGIILFAFITLLIGIAKIISGDFGPLFYMQERIGKNGKKFYLYKYRTMCKDADQMVKDDETMKKYFTDEQIKEWHENYKFEKDPRITPIGNFLRKTSLDEIPQVINIFKGDLSIIGPRPIIEEELEKYGENKDKLLSITPGLTGYWAANGRSNTSYEDRIQMELYYVDNISFKLDVKIFFKTIVSVLKREGAV